ncbi:hypothetical protein ACRRTK_017782 [Alexandromys fortis]
MPFKPLSAKGREKQCERSEPTAEGLRISGCQIIRNHRMPEEERDTPNSAPECSSQEWRERLATVKKARTAALPTDVPDRPATISECLQKPGSSRAPASKVHFLSANGPSASAYVLHSWGPVTVLDLKTRFLAVPDG